MNLLIQGGRLLDPKNRRDGIFDLLIQNEKVREIARSISPKKKSAVINARGLWVFPGLIDAHVHLREPGGEKSETILSGTQAAVKGGVTSLLAMANTRPPIDSPKKVQFVVRRSSKTVARVYPVGAITAGLEGQKLTPFSSMKKAGCVAFSDDGRCVMSEELMLQALKKAKSLNVPLIEHCEDETLSHGGVVNEGPMNKKLKVGGISTQSEAAIVERDIYLSRKSGARIHCAHISCKDSVDLIRKAKKRKILVSAETCPHYFTLTDKSVLQHGASAKMKPPLRAPQDVQAILEALMDGTLETISTDHAPHNDESKSKGLETAPFGIIGLETSFALVYNELVLKGVLTPLEALRKMTEFPARIFRLPGGHLSIGAMADLVLFDPKKEWHFTRESIVSKSHNTPFLNRKFMGQIMFTLVGGQTVYKN